LISQIYFSCIFILFLGTLSFYGQEQDLYQSQISIQHDNDVVFVIDRLYTAGTFIEYSQIINEDFIFKKDTLNPIQLDFRLGQETYTPRELFERDFDLLERPYAGYLFVSGKTTKVRRNHLWSLQGEVGVTGEISLAGIFQEAYHELINEFIPVWEGQIANAFHVNVEGGYIKDLDIKSSFGFNHFSIKSTIGAGTRRTFAKQEATIFIGDRSDLNNSSAFGRIGNNRELYGFATISGTYVAHNAVIEGHLFGDNSPFTLESVPFLFGFQTGIAYRNKRNLFQLIYNFQTRETFREGRLQYASIIVARRF